MPLHWNTGLLHTEAPASEEASKWTWCQNLGGKDLWNPRLVACGASRNGSLAPPPPRSELSRNRLTSKRLEKTLFSRIQFALYSHLSRRRRRRLLLSGGVGGASRLSSSCQSRCQQTRAELRPGQRPGSALGRLLGPLAH